MWRLREEVRAFWAEKDPKKYGYYWMHHMEARLIDEDERFAAAVSAEADGGVTKLAPTSGDSSCGASSARVSAQCSPQQLELRGRVAGGVELETRGYRVDEAFAHPGLYVFIRVLRSPVPRIPAVSHARIHGCPRYRQTRTIQSVAHEDAEQGKIKQEKTRQERTGQGKLYMNIKSFI